MVEATANSELRRHVPLGGDQMLIFQRADNLWLVVLYRRRKGNEAGGEISAEQWERIRKTWMPAKQRREDWVRIGFRNPSLAMGLAHACEQTKPHVDISEVRAYIRATSWGESLPL